MKRLPVMFVCGTRPEAIKLMPILDQFHAEGYRIVVLMSDQHPFKSIHECCGDLMREADSHDILAIDKHGMNFSRKSMGDLVDHLSRGIDSYRATVGELRAIAAVGDTNTVLAAALASVDCKLKFIHIEAGLRSGNKLSPWPEEANRIMVDSIADMHFCPTEIDSYNLTPAQRRNAHIVGNTSIDACRLASDKVKELTDQKGHRGGPVWPDVIFTSHRKENKPHRQNIADAASQLAADGHCVWWIKALDPKVNEQYVLNGVRLIEPQDYLHMLALIAKAKAVVTDSGGIIEECSYFGTPCVVARDWCERWPAYQGIPASRICKSGASENNMILNMATVALKKDYMVNVPPACPFGDGHAAERIVKVLIERYGQ